MIIQERIEKGYKNQIEIIKKERNYVNKQKMVGALVLDLGARSINAVAAAIESCWRYVKKCYLIVKENLSIPSNKHKCGRKLLIEKYPNLKEDIEKIIEDYLCIDPRFKSEKQYVRLSIKEIKNQLIETGKYKEKSFSNSYLNNLLNEMGYGLKKVRKNKPLKKIEETDLIFANVKEKKEQAKKEKQTVEISVDTKDKILIGPYSRGGKNRIQIEAVDHELTNDCLIPFGILDLKTNIPHFYNFTKKPTSLDLVECIEEFWEEEYANSKQKKLTIFLDNGPDNSGVRTIFLKGLIEISKKYKITIELVYYPPYHSKYNPVERLWARLENIWNGYLLETKEICLNFMKNLTWKDEKSITKLKEVKYEKGLSVEKKEMEELEEQHITRHEKLKKWSLVITP